MTRISPLLPIIALLCFFPCWGIDLRATEVTPMEFGAKADGVTDDTAAILQAFAAVKNGGVLRFSGGTYAIRGLQRIDSLQNCTVEASGSVIRNLEPTGSFQIQKTRNFVWRGGELTYLQPPQQNTQAQHPLYLLGCENVRIENLYIHYSPYMGLVINNCRSVWVQNCRIESTRRDGLHLVHTQDFFITGNFLSNTIDDAIACIDYGAPKDQRTRNGIVTGNMIVNCRQGLVAVNATDLLFSNNRVDGTVFSGCQITTNDRFRSQGHENAAGAARVRVTGNDFLRSGSDLTLQDEFIRNSGQLTTGRAAVVVSYIDREKGWNRNGREYFSSFCYPCAALGDGRFRISADARTELWEGRGIRLQRSDASDLIGTATELKPAGETLEFRLSTPSVIPPEVGTAWQLSTDRTVQDIEISGNRISNSAVDAIYANGVNRLTVRDNTILDCNRSNSQWTGKIVEIQNTAPLVFRNNDILEPSGLGLHKTPSVLPTSSK